MTRRHPSPVVRVLRTLVDNGARVLDTAPAYAGGSSEQVAGAIANELGIQKKIFWATKVNVARGGEPHRVMRCRRAPA